MKRPALTAACLLLAAAATATAAATAEDATTSAAPPAALPAIRFYSSIAATEIYADLHADPLFAHLDQELPGCPILLRVTHSVEPTSGGKAAGVATGLLAAGTLGIIPMVTNDDFVVYYEVIVNNTVVSTHVYRRNFTRSRSLWNSDRRNTLGNEGLAWVKGTAAQFLADARSDAALADLNREYGYYFGDTAPAVPAANVAH